METPPIVYFRLHQNEWHQNAGASWHTRRRCKRLWQYSHPYASQKVIITRSVGINPSRSRWRYPKAGRCSIRAKPTVFDLTSMAMCAVALGRTGLAEAVVPELRDSSSVVPADAVPCDGTFGVQRDAPPAAELCCCLTPHHQRSESPTPRVWTRRHVYRHSKIPP